MTDQEFQQTVLGALAGIQSTVGVLHTDVGILKSDVGALKSDVGALKSDVGALKSDVVSLNTRFDRMEAKLDTVSSDLTEFKENQEGFNDAIWNMNTQAFQAVNEVRNEVLPPWKARKASMV